LINKRVFVILKIEKYGGVLVSTRKRSISCMRRISVGLLKKPVKKINADYDVEAVYGVAV